MLQCAVSERALSESHPSLITATLPHVAQAIQAANITNTTALCFTPDRSYTIKLGAIVGLTKMSQRYFEKGDEGKTVSIRLHQQSGLGEGRVVLLTDVMVDDEHDTMPAALQRDVGAAACGTAAGMGVGPARARGREQAGRADMQLRAPRLSKKGLSLARAAIARRREERKRQQAEARQHAVSAKRLRRAASEVLYCEDQPGGCAGCAFFCRSHKWMARHQARGKHRTRREGGHAVGTVVGMRDRIVRAAAAAHENRVAAEAPRQPQALGASATVEAEGFMVTLLSGRSAQLSPPAAGYACNTRLPSTHATPAMYRYAAWAADLKESGKALKNKEGLIEMRRAGTQAFADDWADDEYVKSITTADGSPFFSRLELFEHPTLKALLTKGGAYCRAQAVKAQARIDKAATVAGKRARPGGGAAGTAGAAGAAGGGGPKRPRLHSAGQLISTKAIDEAPIPRGAMPFAKLPPADVFGVGAPTLAHFAAQWPTLQDLSDLVGSDGVADLKAIDTARMAIAARMPEPEPGKQRGKVAGRDAIALLAVGIWRALGGGGGAGGGATTTDGGEGGGEGDEPEQVQGVVGGGEPDGGGGEPEEAEGGGGGVLEGEHPEGVDDEAEGEEEWDDEDDDASENEDDLDEALAQLEADASDEEEEEDDDEDEF